MIVTFAYTNDKSFLDAINSPSSGATYFSLNVASVTPLVPFRAKAYRWELADGSPRVLKTAKRYRQSFTTMPNLLLTGDYQATAGKNGAQLLEDWFFAESLWINTGLLTGRGEDNFMVRVNPTGDEVPKEAFQSILLAQQVTTEFETVYPVGTSF